MFPKIVGVASPADPEGKDGHGPPGTSEESPEEFTDTKHESLFSLETNFLEEESGSDSSPKASQGQSLVYIVWIHLVLLLLLSRFSHVRLCATPWTAAHQAPPSMRFSRQEYWSGVPLPSPVTWC